IACVSACGHSAPSAADASKGVVDAATDDAADADLCATVVCACSTDTDCGMHAYCNTTGPGRSCACVAGYTDAGSGCGWTGVVANPAVPDSQVWIAAKGAVVNAGATGVFGAVDPGNATCTSAQACDLPSVSQTITVPPIDRAEPLVLVVSHQ